MLKKSLIISLSLLATQVVAQELVELSNLIQKSSARISTLAQRIEYGNTNQSTQKRLKTQLTDLIQNAKTMKSLLKEDSSPHPTPVPRPRNPVEYSAKCHIDDDPNLDLNQEVVAVEAQSLSELVSECEILAMARHSSRAHSSGITDIQYLGQIKKGMVSADCHIDDDPSLDYNQVMIGTLFGYSLSEVINSCKMISEMHYSTKGSAGLQNVNSKVKVPNRMKSGDCHIDDDPSFDLNQDVVGFVYGVNVQSLMNQCEEIALMNHGSQSSSAVINIK